MVIKSRILLAFTLVLGTLVGSPAQAISSAENVALAKANRSVLRGQEKKDRLEEAKSALKTFKKDIKCMFSREGCTKEQKIRLLKQGLGLVGIIALLTGGWFVWKARAKKREDLSAKASAQAEAAAAKREGEEMAAQQARERQEAKRAAELERERQAEAARLEREEAERLEREQLARERQATIARLEGELATKRQVAAAAGNKVANAETELSKAKTRLRESKELIYGRGMGWATKEHEAFAAAQRELEGANAELRAVEAALERARRGN